MMIDKATARCEFCSSAATATFRVLSGYLHVKCCACQACGPLRPTEAEAVLAWNTHSEDVAAVRASVPDPMWLLAVEHNIVENKELRSRTEAFGIFCRDVCEALGQPTTEVTTAGTNGVLMEVGALKADRARLRELERFMVWQPMSTAPRDGTEVLLRVRLRAGIPGKMLVGHYMPGGHCVEDHPPIAEGWYFLNGAMFDHATEPICWMRLPAQPDA